MPAARREPNPPPACRLSIGARSETTTRIITPLARTPDALWHIARAPGIRHCELIPRTRGDDFYDYPTTRPKAEAHTRCLADARAPPRPLLGLRLSRGSRRELPIRYSQLIHHRHHYGGSSSRSPGSSASPSRPSSTFNIHQAQRSQRLCCPRPNGEKAKAERAIRPR